MNSVEILRKLVALPTVPKAAGPNREAISFVAEFLAARGIEPVIVPSGDDQMSNIFATVGPRKPGGTLLSGQIDVVPANAAEWDGDSFALHERADRLMGQSAHSAFARSSLNAIYLANDFISHQRDYQREIELDGPYELAHETSFSTLHVGTISGGSALNVVPENCMVGVEFRNIAADAPQSLLARLQEAADRTARPWQDRFPAAKVALTVDQINPAFHTEADAPVVDYAVSLSGAQETLMLDFGTEAGFLQRLLGVPVVVCGPGSIDNAHCPNEWGAISQIAACDRFMDNLLTRSCA